nr:MAG TPA: putative tail-component [Caudoviricetes sp.]
MGRKKITIELTESGIDQAIKELEEYKKDIEKKTALLQDKIAKRIAEEADKGFASAVVDDLVRGGYQKPDVTVSYTTKGDISVVIAQGEDAVWVEFGAGVYHNGHLGSSPHPRGSELGMTIGGYGQGKGKQKSWGFKDEEGKLHVTRGTHAQMPMEKAILTVIDELPQLAREVFG